MGHFSAILINRRNSCEGNFFEPENGGDLADYSNSQKKPGICHVGDRLKSLAISRSAANSDFTDTKVGIARKLSRRDGTFTG